MFLSTILLLIAGMLPPVTHYSATRLPVTHLLVTHLPMAHLPITQLRWLFKILPVLPFPWQKQPCWTVLPSPWAITAQQLLRGWGAATTSPHHQQCQCHLQAPAVAPPPLPAAQAEATRFVGMSRFSRSTSRLVFLFSPCSRLSTSFHR